VTVESAGELAPVGCDRNGNAPGTMCPVPHIAWRSSMHNVGWARRGACRGRAVALRAVFAALRALI